MNFNSLLNITASTDIPCNITMRIQPDHGVRKKEDTFFCAKLRPTSKQFYFHSFSGREFVETNEKDERIGKRKTTRDVGEEGLWRGMVTSPSTPGPPPPRATFLLSCSNTLLLQRYREYNLRETFLFLRFVAEDFLSAIQSATVLTSLLAVVKYSISMRKKAMVFPFKILP